MKTPQVEYVSVGGNRHPNAADWDQRTQLLAFGADQNVAVGKFTVRIDGQVPWSLSCEILIRIRVMVEATLWISYVDVKMR